MRVEEIAELCHEVNRAYCLSLGDDSQPAWKDAPEWQQESAINGVLFHMEGETTPEQSHENWMKEKEADGWVWGAVKSPKFKEHPCMVPYHELPLEQRTKDYLFKSIVDTVRNSLLAKTPVNVACHPVEDPGANLWKLIEVLSATDEEADGHLQRQVLYAIKEYIEKNDLGIYELSDILRKVPLNDGIIRPVIREKITKLL